MGNNCSEDYSKCVKDRMQYFEDYLMPSNPIRNEDFYNKKQDLK